MVRHSRRLVGGVLLAALSMAMFAAAGVLSNDDIKKVTPASFFFSGQLAPVQLRNSTGFRTDQGKLVLAGLVDNSGYAADVAERYQGFLISEVKLQIGSSSLPAGAYAFGFHKDGNFVVMDVGGNEVTSAAYKEDSSLAHPVPLRMASQDGGLRLYAGKRWIALAP
jgi:hypothetical protein